MAPAGSELATGPLGTRQWSQWIGTGLIPERGVDACISGVSQYAQASAHASAHASARTTHHDDCCFGTAPSHHVAPRMHTVNQGHRHRSRFQRARLFMKRLRSSCSECESCFISETCCRPQTLPKLQNHPRLRTINIDRL
jgi:hypothetical protein